MTGTRIVGWGYSLPSGTITTSELAARFGIDESWIMSRTGMKERRQGGTTSDLAIAAGRAAMDSCGVRPEEIDLVLVATCSPDYGIPATAARVQNALGIPMSAAACDINAACSGFVYGLLFANGLTLMGNGHTLLVGAETMTGITNYQDRNTAILFGDGAGAVVMAPDESGTLIAWDMGNASEGQDALWCSPGGHMVMDGHEVFNWAVESIVQTVNTTMSRSPFSIADVSVVIPHQANIRILDAAFKMLGVGPERIVTTLDHTGNTSGASIPIAICEAVESDRIHSDDLVLLVGFGAGMSWASALLRWGATP